MGILEDFSLADTNLSLFVTLNGGLTVLCAFWFIYLFLYHRYLFIKPSIFLLSATHIFFQWPLCIFSGYIEVFLPEPYTLSLLVNTYVIVGLAISSFTLRALSQQIWENISVSPLCSALVLKFSIILLIAFVILTIGIYCSIIPFSKTGLYALLYSPNEYDNLRTSSFKDLPTFMKYAFSFLVGGIAPLLGALFAILANYWWQQKRYFMVIVSVLVIVILTALSSITGARYNAVKLLATAGLAILLIRKLPFYPLRYTIGTLSLLTPAAMFTLFREGREISLINSFKYLIDEILIHRVLVTPLQVGMWHVQFAQLRDYFGAAAIPKLAALFSIDPMQVPIFIGRMYLPHPTFESHCDAGYLLTYYSYFGMMSLPISIALLFALDLILPIYKRLSSALLVPCIAATALAMLEFIQSDYTTVLITHGFILIPLTCFGIELIAKYNREDIPKDSFVTEAA